MTSLKTIVVHRDILNFSRDRISKSFVRQTLRKTQFDHIIHDDKKSEIVINHITVGMYHIQLVLEARGGLRNFEVQIREGINIFKGHINLKKDGRFNTQYWNDLNQQSRLTTENLVDIIMHCHRLNSLKTFL